MIYLTEEMFSTGKPVAQGEVLIWMKKYAPKAVLTGMAKLKLSAMPLENGMMILGHSETGHHHVLEPVAKDVPISKAALALIDADNNTFVELRVFEQCRLMHLRGHDTHVGLVLPPGDYIKDIREEQIPEGWRQSQD